LGTNALEKRAPPNEGDAIAGMILATTGFGAALVSTMLAGDSVPRSRGGRGALIGVATLGAALFGGGGALMKYNG
jgi:hypothetical protein